MATDLYEISGLCVDVEYMIMGVLANNVYIVSDGEGTMVVDPSCSADKILAALGERKLDVIVLTHSHFDHTGAAAELREATGAPVIASAIDAPLIEEPCDEDLSTRGVPCPVDRTVAHGDVVEVGNMKWKVIATQATPPVPFACSISRSSATIPRGFRCSSPVTRCSPAPSGALISRAVPWLTCALP